MRKWFEITFEVEIYTEDENGEEIKFTPEEEEELMECIKENTNLHCTGYTLNKKKFEHGYELDIQTEVWKEL